MAARHNAEGGSGSGAATWPLRYAAIFLLMMSNLLLELLLTRLFSATMWYHFAFIAVSIAMFGTTFGAVAVQLFPRHFAAADSWRRAGQYALLFAVSMTLCTALQMRMHLTFGATWFELAQLALLYLIVAVPFTLAGVVICLALTRAEQRVGVVYCADLLGAGVACMVFVSAMRYADGPRAALLLGVLAAIGAALLARSAADRRTERLAAVAALAAAAVFVLHLDGGLLRVRWAKGQPDAANEFETWNAFSRLVVVPAADNPLGWGLSPRLPADGTTVEQKLLFIDNAAGTLLTAFDGDFATVDHLRYDVTSLAYSLRRPGTALIIGVGGGRDILAALAFGHPHVVGVEVNDDILGLLRGPYAAFTGHLAGRPDVELVHDEARSFIARQAQHFDVIQASLVDTWAAAANGAYVLSENALYTRDAFDVFLDHLTPDGVLTMSRWYYEKQPGETWRLLSLAASVLRQRGVAEPRRHLFAARTPFPDVSVATLLVSARPFTAQETHALRAWCAEMDFIEIVGPDGADDPMVAALTAPEEPAALLASAPIDLSPPTDDRPFFFNMLRLRDALRGVPTNVDVVRANADAVATLVWLLAIVIVLSLVFILGPLWIRRAADAPAPRGAARLLYFAGLGVGFILIELSLMQRLMIVLGHPVYGLTVVLLSLLTAAGLGSLWTARLRRQGYGGRFLLAGMLALLGVCLLVGLAGSALVELLDAQSTAVRLGSAIALLAPLGFVLGMPMAFGLSLSEADPPGYRALYWGANGAASVCASVLATLLSLAFGIRATYLAGVLVYAVVAAVAARAFAASDER